MKIQKYHKKQIISVATAAASAITNISVTWSMYGGTSFSIETSWGANVTGTWSLWEKNGGSYRQNTDVTFVDPDAAASGQVMNVIDAEATDYKLVYAATSGTTGPLQAWLVLKEFT